MTNLSKEIMRQYQNGKSLRQVAASLNVAQSRVHYVLKCLGIPRRGRIEGMKLHLGKYPRDQSRRRKIIDPQKAVRLYQDGKTLREVAEFFKTGPSTVHRALKNLGSPCRKKGWKIDPALRYKARARRISNYGYVLVRRPDHPRAQNSGYVFEHILVLEAKLGRSLNRDEVTHHIDGNKQNNDPENLQVMSSQDHTRHHINSVDAATREYMNAALARGRAHRHAAKQ